jgi:hypothetical protein
MAPAKDPERDRTSKFVVRDGGQPVAVRLPREGVWAAHGQCRRHVSQLAAVDPHLEDACALADGRAPVAEERDLLSVRRDHRLVVIVRALAQVDLIPVRIEAEDLVRQLRRPVGGEDD